MENKAAARARLESEGRWKEALQFREELKRQGRPPAEAHKEMVRRYPPLPAGTAAGTPADTGAGVCAASVPASVQQPRRKRRKASKAGQRIDWRGEVEWTYLHLGEPTDRGAPSAGTAALWKWAVNNQDDFLKSFVARMLPTGARLEKEEGDDRDTDGQAGLDLIEKFMRDNNIPMEAPDRAAVPAPV